MGSRGTKLTGRNRNALGSVGLGLVAFAFAAAACVTSGPEGGWKPAPYTAPPPPGPPEEGFGDMDDDPEGPATPATAEPGATATPGAPTEGLGDDGAACTKGGDCKSGVCEGVGCEPDKGKCMAKDRACTGAKMQLCDCTGKTVAAEKSSCPGVTYKYPGPCK
jgi:hypothetical protein